MTMIPEGIKRGYLPAEPFTALLRDHLMKLGHGNPEISHSEEHALAGELARLDQHYGINDRQIYRLFHETKRQISFDMADRIMTALGLWHWWHEDPYFSALYEEVDLRRPDEIKPFKFQRRCSYCNERFETTSPRQHTCSSVCRTEYNRLLQLARRMEEAHA